MNLRSLKLDDRLDTSCSTVLLSGSQALVRMLLLQKALDAKAGLNTSGYVSGYRGSPLGAFDMALWKAGKHLKASDIVFHAGINEDLAATAVWGTQQIDLIGQATVDGVFGLWYGKGPGVDRSGDALKHANYAGVHPRGGVLAVFGDDHPGKSSSIAHHSEQAMAANGLPVLYPSNVQDTLEFGLLGFAMSRYSGCWVSMKMVNETAEQTALAELDVERFQPTLPDASDLLPPEGVHFRGNFGPLRDESILLHHRLPLVARFARANRIDRLALGGAGPMGIVTAGKAYQDVRQALGYLGIDDARAIDLGLGVYKVGMIWPLEADGLREFAAGRRELMMVEEKAAFLQAQAAAVLYNDAERPLIVGKHDPSGAALLPLEQSLEPMDVAFAIANRLRANGIWDDALAQRVASLRSYRSAIVGIVPGAERRMPYFCSGCPHNTSTTLPEGSVAVAGIGCHGMAMWAKPRTLISTQMGGEGLNWVGLHRFTRVAHVFQNLGDGTYFHSGLMAVRAAIASGANITYKILFNDAVAMTGGQPVDGQISVGEVAHQVLHEGVKRIVVVTDEPERYAGNAGLPGGIEVVHREELQRVQKALRDTAGCTVMIYDQTCAAEKRRRRKKGEFPDPDQRMFINEAVCEGCGDCSAKSGCVSIEPRETELGRKRSINQSACNKDYSCVNGFCPSFVTVRGGRPRKPEVAAIEDAVLRALPEPALARIDGTSYGVMVAGIGGTGVITVSAVLAMAAHLESLAPSTYDMTGLSQKNGAVYSHLRIARRPLDIASQRLGVGDASLVLAFDMVAALGDESVRSFSPEKTRFLGNDRVQETAALVSNPDARVDTGLLQRKVAQRVAAGQIEYVDATGLAQALFGDTIAANLFMLGVAAQRSWLPVGLAAIEKAIELNGVQVALNLRAFHTGRLWVEQPQVVMTAAASHLPPRSEPVVRSVQQIVEHRTALLTAYQDAAYARRYGALVQRTALAERRAIPGSDELARAVAQNFAKLMAYKDEYEVARLYTSPEFQASLRNEFEGDFKLSFNLAPPLFSRRDPSSGQLRKREYGAWMLPAMKLLARLRFVRGTRLDPMGYTAERRMERALIDEYETTIEQLLASLGDGNFAVALEIATLPEQIRGYGHVKDANVAKVRPLREALLARFAEAPVRRALAA